MNKQTWLPVRALACALVLLLACFSFSCKDEEVPPTTGDVLVVVNRMTELEGVKYSVYTEAYLTSTTYVPPLLEGTINKSRIALKDLNAGNYVMQLHTGYNWRLMLQVTAGKERTFYID